jgi:tryptophan 2,3-dioxygenase
MTHHPTAGYAPSVTSNQAPGPVPDSAAGDWGGTDIAFGEHGARLTYGRYLALEQLLGAQRLASDPPAHDELLFITVHQVYELWFKQLLHEATAARDAMLGRGSGAGAASAQRPDRSWWAQHLLQRMHAIERILLAQVDVLETMTPQDFLEFRQALAPASGFQSVQYRELEFLSGAKDPSFVERFKGLTDTETERLRRRLDEPTLWDAFLSVLGERGLPAGSDEEVTESVRRAAHDRASYSDVWALAEGLLQHDELAAAWRARHVVMVERMIGTRSGTGGSSGADYLRSRLPLRYYPLLWELRSHL